MQPENVFGRYRIALVVSFLIDQCLHFDVCDRLYLQRAALRLASIVFRQRSINIARMRVMSFDQVGVITVHRAHKHSNRLLHYGIDPSGQSAGL